jgi:type II restriction enzyme
LREEKGASAKGWLLDVMSCIEKIGIEEFSLNELYTFEKFLSKKYPDNMHIKDKIRQQLQVLRDKGYLEFVERGRYRLK